VGRKLIEYLEKEENLKRGRELRGKVSSGKKKIRGKI
jgi:hypothetical protein